MENKAYEQMLEKNNQAMLKKQEELKELKKNEKKLKAEQKKLEQELHKKRLTECGEILEKVNPNLVNLNNEELTKILTNALTSDSIGDVKRK